MSGPLFLSYNRRDSQSVRAIRAALEARGLPTFLDAESQRAGQNWVDALERALKECAAVAVFVGPQLGAWQWREIGFALDRQAGEPGFPVIPVLLEGADTTRSFLFQNTWVDLRADRFLDPAVLDRLVETVRHPEIATNRVRFPGLNPFRGLEFFDEAHAPFFFGREAFVEDLFKRLVDARKNFVAVIGASGSGKSSVVRAGLVPRLRRQRPPKETWDVAVFIPSDRPWFRLADALGMLRFPDMAGTELDIEIDKLYRALQAGALALDSLLNRILQPQGQAHRLLLVIDQFEELFTLGPPTQRPFFIQALLGALQLPQVTLVPTLRADFYGQAIEADRTLSDLLGREQITLGRLTLEELRRATVEPARLAGLTFEPGLPERLLRDAGNEPGNLPLLQHALLELHVRRQGNELTNRAYDDVGGIRRAIATSAEGEYQRLADAHKPLARQVFTQLVRLARADEGLEDTRRRVPIGAIPEQARALVDEFSSARLRLLIKAHERLLLEGGSAEKAVSEQETVEVAHEALIREWGRLQGWLNEDRGFYLWRQRLDQAMREYQEHSDHPDYLLHGVPLKEAEGKLAAPMPEPLGQTREAFVHRSLEERDRVQQEQREAEERVRAEKERLLHRERDALAQAADRERQAREAAEAAREAEQQAREAAESTGKAEESRRIAAERGRRTLRWGAVALLMIALLAGYQWYHANQQWQAATAQTLALRANAAREDVLALLLAALSLQIGATREAKDTAINLLARQAFTSSPLRGHGSLGSNIAFSPDGTRIVSGTSDHTLRLWDVSSEQPIGAPLLGHEDVIRKVAFSPDGSQIVSGSSDRTLRLWDARSGQPIGAPLRGHESAVWSVVFNPDGTRVVSGGSDSTLRLWDAPSGHPIGAPLRGHEGPVFSVALSPDGNRIVSGSSDRTLRLWDARSGQPIGAPLRGHQGTVFSVALSPDGTRIVSGSSDRTLRLWDAHSGQPIGAPLRGHEDAVWRVAFSPDGILIVSGGSDNTLRLWDAHSGQPIGAPLRGDEELIRLVAFSPGGARIVGGSSDRTRAAWDTKLLESAQGLRWMLCMTLHRNLTREEWDLNVPAGGSYRKVCAHLPLEGE